MTDARECILTAADKLTALEKAKVDLEAAKQKVADLKQEYDDQIAACEEAGLTKAKARKAVQGIVDVLVDADLVDLPAEKPKTPRKARASKAAKQEESSEDSSETGSSEGVIEQHSTADQSDDDVREPVESPVEPASTEGTTGAFVESEVGVSDESGASVESEVGVSDESGASEEVAPEVPADEVPVQEEVSSNEEFGEPEVVEASNPSEIVSEDEIDVFDAAGEEEVVEAQQEPTKRSDFSLPAFMRK